MLSKIRENIFRGSDLKSIIKSPFKFDSVLLQKKSVSNINEMYLDKCNVDIREHFGDLENIELYECKGTGYKFWYPFSLAGNERFYQKVSAAWSNYYRTDRWEYDVSQAYINKNSNVLEIGCGRGYFLKRLEEKGVKQAVGLDFNNEAIKSKITKFDILSKDLRGFESQQLFDVICSFQVLEHISDPMSFLEDCKSALNNGGLLILSVPNNNYSPHKQMQDAFDLPPHHVGHYTSDILKKIAQVIDMNVLDIVEQSVDFNHLAYRERLGLLYKLAYLPLRIRHRVRNRTGHTVLLVLKKKSFSSCITL